MEQVTIDTDIVMMCVQATSFPAGVLEAHQTLHRLLPPDGKRRYYGLSRPEGSMTNIVYRAAAEQQHEGEANELGLDTITIKKGTYLNITIHNFMNNLPAIGNAFQQLLQQPGIDMQGYCIEWYYNDTDVHCMVRLAD